MGKIAILFFYFVLMFILEIIHVIAYFSHGYWPFIFCELPIHPFINLINTCIELLLWGQVLFPIFLLIFQYFHLSYKD